MALVVIGLAAGWVLTRGLPWQKSSAQQAKDVLEPFVQALRGSSFGVACGFLAHTAPPKQPGLAGCPSRLRRASARDDWSKQLRSVDVIVTADQSGKLYVNAFDPRGVLDGDAVYRFVLVREGGSLRIERFAGRF